MRTGPLSVECRRRHFGATLEIVMHGHLPRLAADGAVFNIFLRFAAVRVECDFYFFAAIRAANRCFGVGRDFSLTSVFIMFVVTHGISPVDRKSFVGSGNDTLLHPQAFIRLPLIGMSKPGSR